MRLSKIRIAGFKSFVDPVTLDLRSNLVGILGPNGCGKSNTIDAVRWVMGESSAKHLRGQSMDDVIFNGSSTRKPVGQASVELVFDNSSGQLGGEYAQYAEISVKRLVSRDGASKYFLNGSRCRRRDITDIFLGTGLGPRSYAIIEQGMISRLIEAKPEELRNTLEEAAGISRYKDRRRETENRIRHTRENLERLTDLREELDKQLQKLDRQAKAAAKFKELRQTERQLEAMLLLLQEQALQEQDAALTTELGKQSTAYQDQLSAVRTLESSIELLRQQLSDANEDFNTVQGQFYQSGAEISRIEQSIQYQQETRARQQSSLDQIQQSLAETLLHADEDRNRLQENQQRLTELEPRADSLAEMLAQAEERLFDAEEQVNGWQEQWEALQQRIAEPSRQAQIEKNRMDQLLQQLTQQQQRLERLQQEATQLSTSQFATEIQELETQLAQSREAYLTTEQLLEEQTQSLQELQQSFQSQQHELNEQRTQQQSVQGRLASLETLQQAAIDKSDKSIQDWLQKVGLSGQPRLAECLEVVDGWEVAVETVLRDELDAVCVGDLGGVLAGIGEYSVGVVETPHPQPPLPKGEGALHITTAKPLSLKAPFPQKRPWERGWGEGKKQLRETPNSDNVPSSPPHPQPLPPQGGKGAQALANKIIAPTTLQPLLNKIYCTDSLDSAIEQRQQLAADESFITPDGVILGRHFIKIPRKTSETGSVLQRRKTIRDLQNQQQQLEQSIAILEQDCEQSRTSIKDLEQQRQSNQSEANRLHREESTLTSQLSNLQQRIEQLTQRQQRSAIEIAETTQQIEHLENAHQQATEQRNEALERLEILHQEREALALHKENYYQAQTQARGQVREYQDEQHEVKLELESCRQQIENSQRQLERVAGRIESLEQQREGIQKQLLHGDEPEELLRAELEEALAQKSIVEAQLTEARSAVQAHENQIRERDAERVSAEKQADALRDRQEQLKLEWQAVQVRLQTVSELLTESEADRAELQSTLTEEQENEQHYTQTLADVQQRIQRLGAINLAAIDEYQEQSERKVWLDQQNDDLVAALETLETAIRKIDRETRLRFRQTFDHVNSRLGAMFPRLFGGGDCFLEMTDDDLLTTGVAIMAKPPGKRISSIHLMSGGEKALTAVALVFAIFELNPAPFCMLDEVDAPLDEANVGRFCDLVRQMSEQVQFIFITHNKRTMELAEHLVGVTMREPGVSRLVAVDMAEAVQLAGS